MTEFKKGDKIRMKCNCSGSYKGQIYTLAEIAGEVLVANYEAEGKAPDGCSCENNWEPVVEESEGYCECKRCLKCKKLIK
jgi:hypothetical protein